MSHTVKKYNHVFDNKVFTDPGKPNVSIRVSDSGAPGGEHYPCAEKVCTDLSLKTEDHIVPGYHVIFTGMWRFFNCRDSCSPVETIRQDCRIIDTAICWLNS